MGAAIGDILPLAVGIATLSLLPLMVMILILFGEKARRAGLGFLAGWLLGLAALTAVVVFAVDTAEEAAGGQGSPFAGIVLLVLGALLLFLAYRKWRKRPGPEEEAEAPKWMRSLDTLTGTKALGLGVLLVVANVKNLPLVISAGVAIASAGLSPAETAITVAVFVIVGSVSVAAPVVLYVVLGEKAGPTLNNWKDWLIRNSATVMMMLFLVLGVVLIGNGVGALT